MPVFDAAHFREQFPLLKQTVNGKPLVYFDNAATTQKFAMAVNSQSDFYLTCNANVHRGSHYLSAKATSQFEAAREKVQKLINATSTQEIIWTKGATESINLIAQSWGAEHLKPGDEIVLSYAEHHANIVPWQVIADKTGAVIKVLPLDHTGRVDSLGLLEVINSNTKVVCCAHVSNVIGKVNPIEKIIARAKQVGAITLIDGAQAIAHHNIDVQTLDCDFYVFSAHKFYGPTGVGVLYGKKDLLEVMSPYQYGGEMIKQVSFKHGTTFNELPFKFETGTPNIAGIIAFSTAITCFQRFSLTAMQHYEQDLIDYAYQRLTSIKSLNFIVAGPPDIGIFSFTIEGFHNQDIAAELDIHAIAIRTGHHCAMPLMEYLGLAGCIRLSIAPYNTKEEIDYVVQCLQRLINVEENFDVLAEPSDKMSIKSHIESNLSQENILVNSSIKAILINFSQAKTWDARHRQVMLYGKQLERLTKNLRSDASLISGCESQAWLTYQMTDDGKLSFSGDSDAKVIRGLLFIVLAAYQHRSPKDILAFNIDQYFTELGLLQHLSPSRGNGLLAIVAKIKKIAKEL
jgi:SufS family cysteine desulfurase